MYSKNLQAKEYFLLEIETRILSAKVSNILEIPISALVLSHIGINEQ